MGQLRFIISVFGDRHVNMLLPLLYSIETSCPDAGASIYWEDISDETKSILKKGFSQFQFIDTHFNFTTDITKRISSKTLVWEFAAHQEKHSTDWLLFIDADTLVVRNPLTLLENSEADIIITERNESPFWINSGVIACRNKDSIAPFFTQWREETQHILNNPELFAQANSKTLPYGGADQMSLQKLIGYSKTQNVFFYQNITIKTIHCRFLNETYSTPITNDTHIIHYKGGWRDILFFQGNFTKNRTKQDSWAMYTFYILNFQKAVETVNQRLGTQYTTNDFYFSLPFYIHPKTLKERFLLYRLFYVLSWFKSIPSRFSAYIKERVR